MSEKMDRKETAKKIEDESALELTYSESRLEETLKKPEVDHSKLYVWIADSGNDRIQKFDGNGKFISQFGSSGGTRPPYAPGDFKTPSGVTVDAEGNTWVADSGCHRIQKFDEDGDFLLEFGTEGWGQDKFYFPENIIAEPVGTILVVDTSNHSVKRYDEGGDNQYGPYGFSNDIFRKIKLILPPTLSSKLQKEVSIFIELLDTVTSRICHPGIPFRVYRDPTGCFEVSRSIRRTSPSGRTKLRNKFSISIKLLNTIVTRVCDPNIQFTMVNFRFF
jgi:DNA-binding beta-propeller fold protein YncE